jgi:hypothetical protein
MDDTKNTAADADKSAPAPDYEALLAEKDAKIAKVSEERDNYRKGMLKAKGKLPEDEEVDVAEIARQAARDEILSSEVFKAQQEKDALIVAMTRELKEAKVALNNRAQVSSSSSGAGADTSNIKPQFFSDDQLPSIRQSYERAKMAGGAVGTFEEYTAKVKENLKNK